MLNLQSSAYNIRSGGEGQYEFFADISTRSLLSVRVGESAGKISTGSGNAFVGYESGKQNMEGSFGTFVGFQAGSLNQYANYCTFVGAFAGLQNHNGNANTFVGYRAGELNKDGSECVGVGAYTLRENTSGSRIVAIGYRAAERTLDGDFNTIIGAESGQDNRSGNFNTMAGFRSGRASFRGNENTYFGAYAGYSNSFGDGNAFIGYKAGEYLQDGQFNVAVGAYALQRAEHGDCNIAIGAFAGSIATGSGNLYVGTNAGASNVTGDYNVYLGSDTGALANGSENVYIGKSAACNLQGNQNVIIGAYTFLDRQTDGSVVIGYRIGENFQTGNCNVLIGYSVDTHDTDNSFGIAIGTKNVKTYNNAISIGQDIETSGISDVNIGNTIICDAENTVSIGNEIDVSSVYVLADRLDWRFPLNQSKAYTLFNMQESYTDTINIDMGTSLQKNTSAIFAVYSSNLYNSGDHRQNIPILSYDSNLTKLFYTHLNYTGAVIPLYNIPTTISNIDQIIQQQDVIRIQNGVGLPFIPSSNTIFMNEQCNLSMYPITIQFTNDPYNIDPGLLTTKVGTLGINLIKKDEDLIGGSNQFIYAYYFPKRIPPYNLASNGYVSNISIPSRYEYIRTASNIEAWNFNIWNYDTISSPTIQAYPPSGLTDFIQIIPGSGEYRVTQSSYIETRPTYRAFDKINTPTSDSYWQSVDGTYTVNGGLYNSNNYTIVNGVPLYGEWCQLQLPTPIYLTSYSISARQDAFYAFERRNPRTWTLVGSEEGQIWRVIDRQFDYTWIWDYPTNKVIRNVQPVGKYTYYRLIVHEVGNIGTTDNRSVSIADLEFNGYTTPVSGYDPGIYGNVLSNIILEQPRYGILNSNSYSQSPDITYTPFPESLFASQDEFTICPVRQIESVYLLSDRSNVITLYSSNIERFNSNVIFLHPFKETTIDRSHILRKPIYDPATSIQLQLGTNMTLKKNNVPYLINPISTTYQDIIDQKLTLSVTDSNISIDTQLQVTVGTDDYPLSIFYDNTCNIINDFTTSNITVTIPTSNVVVSIQLPSLSVNAVYVRKYATYGLLTIPESITNVHQITYQSYHPTRTDACEFLVQYPNGDHIDYKILNYTFIHDQSNVFFSVPLYKVQDTPYLSLGSTTQAVLLNVEEQILPLTVSITSNTSVSILNAGSDTPPSIQPISFQFTSNISSYPVNDQYLKTSNIIHKHNFNKILYAGLTISDKNKLPLPTPWDGQACNIYYYKYTSEDPLIYPNTLGSYNIDIINKNYTQTYSLYYYGVLPPYYEYEPIIGGTNIYWEYRKQIRHEAFYDYASNIIINTSNQVVQTARYYAIQDNEPLYNADIPQPSIFLPTSNNQLNDLSGNGTYKIYTSNYIYYLEVASNISAFTLLEKDFYQYNGFYQYQSSNPYIKLIQKNKGIVTQFHQSNIERQEIYIWIQSNLTASTPYQYNSLVFDQNRSIDLNYYYNYTTPASPDQTLSFDTSNFKSQILNGSGANNFTSIPDTFIGIQPYKDGIFIEKDTYRMTNKLKYSQVPEYYYIPLVRSNLALLQYFYVDTLDTPNTARTVVIKPIHMDARWFNPIYVNQGLTEVKNYITSNHTHVIYNNYAPQDILYDVQSHLLDVNQTTFSQQDINDSKIYLSTSNTSGQYEIDYVLKDRATLTPFSQGKWNIKNYKQSIYPSLSLTTSSSNEIIQIQDIYQHRLVGNFWNELDTLCTNHSYSDSNQLYLHMVRNPSKGYFYSSNSALTQQTNVRHRFSYHEWKNDRIYYIPYQPMDLSNETYQFYLEYRGDLSDVYTTTVKNYWSRFMPLLIDSSRVIHDNYRISLEDLPRSAGLIQDGYQWSSNSTTLSIKDYTVPKEITNIPFSQRPTVQTSNLYRNVDSGGFFNIKEVIQYTNAPMSRDLHFFVIKSPSYGCILKETTSYNPNFKYIAAPYFTYTELTQNKVFYHHFGEHLLTDRFSLIVGSLQSSMNSNVYDVTQDMLTYIMTVQDAPKIIQNNPDYVYKLTSNEIRNDYNLLNTTMLNFNKGILQINQSSNLDFYRKEGTEYYSSTSFTKADLDMNKIHYRFNDRVFENNSNINRKNTVQIVLGSQLNEEGQVDPLSTLSYYTNVYLQNWETYLNQYVSCNEILFPLNSNQVVQYTKRSFDASDIVFDNRRVLIEFTLNPNQQQLYLDTLTNTFPHTSYLEQLNTLAYTFRIEDEFTSNLLQIDFTKNKMVLYNSNNDMYGPIPITMYMNKDNIIQVILLDDRNGDNLSIYINDQNYLANVGYDPNFPLNKRIKTFALEANIEDPQNYYNLLLTSNISEKVYLYYNLINFSNRLLFNDFNIFVNTYDRTYEAGVNGSSNYNVIVGKQLDVKGLNNICIGKNFKTIGTDSIILGNNIGVNNESAISLNSLNEIFSSIVVANNSFINSKVRDTIAIGNSILSNIDPALVDMNNFLSKKPVLIGNDITTDLIDFHINFQNTILKTTEGPGPYDSIYIGLNQERVGIGYTQNERFDDSYLLYVNGPITTNDNDINVGTGTVTAAIFSGTATNVSEQLIVGDYINGENYDGKTATTWSVDASIEPIPNKVVARNSIGTIYSCNIDANFIKTQNVVIGLKDQILYPPAFLTSATELLTGYSNGNGIYTVTESSYASITNKAWRLFDGASNHPDVCWGTDNRYNNNGGAYIGTEITVMDGQSYYGEWAQIQTPSSFILNAYEVIPRLDSSYYYDRRTPRTWYLAGSINGNDWDMIDIQSSNVWIYPQTKYIELLTNTAFYNYYRFIVNEVGSLTATREDNGYAFLGELKLYGTGNNQQSGGIVVYGDAYIQKSLKVGEHIQYANYLSTASNLIPPSADGRINGVNLTALNKRTRTSYAAAQNCVSTWTTRTSAANNEWRSVCWSPELSIFCAVSYDGSGNRVMTSPDGIIWTTRTSAVNNTWTSVCWSSELSLFVAVADGLIGEQIMTSPNGITWTTRTTPTTNGWLSVCWSPEQSLFVAVAYPYVLDEQVMTSPDGITWTTRTSAAGEYWTSVCWAAEKELFVAVSTTGATARVMTSPDGILWTLQDSPTNDWTSVCWSPELSIFVAVAYSGTGNRVMTSPDGIIWTTRTSAVDNDWKSICWSPELSIFCAVAETGTNNRVMTSPDGITWTTRTSAANNDWTSICWAPELSIFCTVAQTGTNNRVMISAIGMPNAMSVVKALPSQMMVDAQGSVGIGTTIPQATLHIIGGLLINSIGTLSNPIIDVRDMYGLSAGNYYIRWLNGNITQHYWTGIWLQVHNEGLNANNFTSYWSDTTVTYMDNFGGLGSGYGHGWPNSGSLTNAQTNTLTIPNLPKHSQIRYIVRWHFVDSIDNEANELRIYDTLDIDSYRVYFSATKQYTASPIITTYFDTGTVFSGAQTYSIAPWPTASIDGHVYIDTRIVSHTSPSFKVAHYTGLDQYQSDEAIYYTHATLYIR